jgi:hypothetical protein
VSYYRLYFMNSVIGRIQRFAELEVTTDEEAIEVAQRHRGECALELCCRVQFHSRWHFGHRRSGRRRWMPAMMVPAAIELSRRNAQ